MTFRKNFFLRHPLEVARDLIGTELVTINRGIETSGIITEVEAYASDDQASHSFKGETKRNRAMFLEGGHCYVYLIYGLYYCVNVVTEKAGVGSAVLIRALQPLRGIEHMQRRRGTKDLNNLTSGPGKLCQAMGIRREYDQDNLTSSNRILLRNHNKTEESNILYTKRIGISSAVHKKWRILTKEF